MSQVRGVLSLAAYKRKLISSALVILLTIVFVSVSIILVGAYYAIYKEARHSNLTQLSIGNINFQSQIASNLSRLVNNYDFIQFINSDEESRKLLRGKVEESFVNSMQSLSSVVTGVDIYQLRNHGILSAFGGEHTKVLSILQKSPLYFDIPLAYSQNYYDPKSIPKGFMRVYISRHSYLAELFKHYVQTERIDSSYEATQVSVLAFNGNLGDFSIRMPKQLNFYISAQNSLSGSAKLMFTMGAASVVFLILCLTLIMAYLFHRFQRLFLSPLGVLHNILINKQLKGDADIAKCLVLAEMDELYTAAKSLTKISQANAKDMTVFKQVLFQNAVADIHEVKNYVTAVRNRMELLNFDDKLRLSIESVELRVSEYLAKYQKLYASLDHDHMQQHKITLECLDVWRLVEIAKYTVKDLSVRYDDTKINIDVDLAENTLQKQVQISGHHLQMVLSNLINNAAQSASLQDKVITIAVCEQGKHLHVTVTDNGEGFDVQRINDYFTGYSSKATGTGRGLSDTRRIVELAQGHLSLLECEPCVRTTLLIDLPMVTYEISKVLAQKISANELIAMIIITDNPDRYQRLVSAIKKRVDIYFSVKIFSSISEYRDYKKSFFISKFTLTFFDFTDWQAMQTLALPEFSSNFFVVTDAACRVVKQQTISPSLFQ